MSSHDDRDTAITRDSGYAQEQPGAGYGGTTAPPQQYPQSGYQQSGYQQPYGGQHFQAPYYGYGMVGRRGFGRGLGGGMHGPSWSETKPFFLTSEFIGTLLCILGVCITAASARYLDAHGAALFSTVLVAAYTISRGIAKAGTRSRAEDPRDHIHLGSSGGSSEGSDR